MQTQYICLLSIKTVDHKSITPRTKICSPLVILVVISHLLGGVEDRVRPQPSQDPQLPPRQLGHGGERSPGLQSRRPLPEAGQLVVEEVALPAPRAKVPDGPALRGHALNVVLAQLAT